MAPEGEAMTTDTNSVRAQRDGHRLSNVPHAAGSCAEVPTQQVPFADCFISPAAREAADRVMASGWVTTGAEVASFEREFAESVGAPYAVAVTSCTVGLELALRSLHLPPGSCVLSSTNTFCGAVHAIVHAGLKPVLVDVDPRLGMPTPETTADAVAWLRSRGERPAAMVVVHWAGDPADVPALAQAAGLPPSRVVEDAAHAVGTSTAGGAAVGSDSAAACFSFYATKNLPVGEGGMITTNDPDLARAWSRNRLHGMSKDAWRRYQPGGSWRYDVLEPGLKANMSDVQAAIGRAQLANLRPWQRRRAEIAARYDVGLDSLPGIALPHRPVVGRGGHAWHLYAIRVLAGSQLTRDHLAVVLADRGVGTSVHFIPVHQFVAGQKGFYGDPRALPGADLFTAQVLSLPMHPQLTDAQVDHVIDVVAHTAKSNQDP